jgi:hypothetical protein
MLHNEELGDLCRPLCIVRVLKSLMLRWAGHEARTWNRTPIRNVGNLTYGRRRKNAEYNFKMALGEIRIQDWRWMELAPLRIAFSVRLRCYRWRTFGFPCYSSESKQSITANHVTCGSPWGMVKLFGVGEVRWYLFGWGPRIDSRRVLLGASNLATITASTPLTPLAIHPLYHQPHPSPPSAIPLTPPKAIPPFGSPPPFSLILELPTTLWLFLTYHIFLISVNHITFSFREHHLLGSNLARDIDFIRICYVI